MRFRLTTRLPLKPLKAWYDLDDSETGLDVGCLKELLCIRLKQLRDEDGNTPSPAELELSIDEFALLDDSTTGIIRENDLVCISEVKADRDQRKRKATDSNTSVSPKKRKLAKERIIPKNDSRSNSVLMSDSGTEESSSSDSSVQSSDSETESSSSGSETESTSSDSSSSSESSVEVQSSKTEPPKRLPINAHANTNLRLVPPGQGSQATYNRNARRRLKRQHEKAGLQADQAAQRALSSGSANAVPLGVSSSASLPMSISESIQTPSTNPTIPPSTSESFDPESLSSTLRNKNKKKGFKRTMEGHAPQKIRFDDSVSEQLNPASANGGILASSTSVAGASQAPRLVTPSEKQALGLLPSNIIVTSVEVEGDKWDRKKKKKQRDAYGYNDESTDIGRAKQSGSDPEHITLDYGKPENEDATENLQEANVDWVSIEAKWDTLMPIPDASVLSPGTVAAWKELAINPATFTPEILLHLARVKKFDSDTAVIRFTLIQRPGSKNIAFGAISSDDSETAEVEGALSVEEEVDYPLTDVQNTWRIVC